MELDLAAEVAQWPVDSASVAVVDRDGIVAMYDDKQRHRWASVTKIASSLTILDGCAEGVISLDDPLGPPGATLRHLLAHASGLSPDSDESAFGVERRRVYSDRGIDLAAEHLAHATGQEFRQELDDRVLELLDLDDTEFVGRPAHGMVGPITDLAALARELLEPQLLLPQVVAMASTIAYPGLDGVLPGFGLQRPNDWGLGFEIRGHKSPHWTAPENSPATFGHFGQAGSFLWVDREAEVACVSLSDRAFGKWAARVWPPLSSKVLSAYGRAR
ncbi:MAG: serine hydrolase domain-containing protein [Micrococcales bacterium]|nr:serine hydrolase domain-containing protein [Micrococcales bacterium]